MFIKQYKLVVAFGIVCAIAQWSNSASAQVELDSNVNDVVQSTAGLAGAIPYIGPFLSFGASLLFKAKEPESPAVTLAKANNFTKSTSLNDKILDLSATLAGYEEKILHIENLYKMEASERPAITARQKQAQDTNSRIGPQIATRLASIAKIREANAHTDPIPWAAQSRINAHEKEVLRLRSQLDPYVAPNTYRSEIMEQWKALGELVETQIKKFETLGDKESGVFVSLLGSAVNLRIDIFDRLIILEPDAETAKLYKTLRSKMAIEYNKKLDKMINRWISYRQSQVVLKSKLICRGSRMGDVCDRESFWIAYKGKKSGGESAERSVIAARIQTFQAQIRDYEWKRLKKSFTIEDTTTLKVENFGGKTDAQLAKAFSLSSVVGRDQAALFWKKKNSKKTIGPSFKIGPLFRLPAPSGWEPTSYGYIQMPSAYAKEALAYYQSERGKKVAKKRGFVGPNGSDMQLKIIPHFDPRKGEAGTYAY